MISKRMYGVLRLRNACVAIVVMCLCLSGARSRGKDTYFAHPKDMDRKAGYSPRIVGGEKVSPHTYPFQVSLAMPGYGSFCGGSLISNNLVLTAAHCFDGKPDHILVGLGGHDVSKTSDMVVVSTKKYVVHEDYKEEGYWNDIALVRLPKDITFNEYIQPVKLANGSNTYEGDTATFIGWGGTETMDFSDILIRADATIMANGDCAKSNIHYKVVLRPTHLCTSGDGTVGTCSGDSGGPLIVDGVQVGVTSFGTRDCTLGMPSVFTRVSKFNAWIARGHANTLSGQFKAVALIALLHILSN